VDAAEALLQAQARKGFPVINKALMRENRRTIGIAGWHGASYHAGRHQDEARHEAAYFEAVRRDEPKSAVLARCR
jgi:hypothetical protein